MTMVYSEEKNEKFGAGVFAMQKIALIGPMGSGKSTLALQYKAKCGGTVFDTDEAFTASYGDISRYMATYGEHAFRKLEYEQVIAAINSGADIVSCGGGAVLDKRSMLALRKQYSIVCLTAPIDVLKERIKNSDRPLKAGIEKIVAEREHLYRKYADYTIDTSCGDGVKKLVQALSQPRKNRYDILLCDADDTVLDFQTAMRTSIINAARIVGIKAADEKIIEEFGDITVIVWRKLEDEGLTRDQLDGLRFAMLKERLNEDFDTSAMSEAFFSEMKKTRFLIDGATEFLSKVRERGIKVYIVTNGFAPIARERLKALNGYMDGAFISDEIGYNKPDPRLFDYVFDTLGVDRSRALVFGDSVNSDIRGGVNSGLDTCLYDPHGKTESSADYNVRSYAELEKIL